MDKLSTKLFTGKKVLIFGLGVNQGGIGSAKFFAQNKAIVRVTDLKTQELLQTSIDQLKEFPETEYTLGEHRYEDIDWADLIIKNPGVKPENKYIEYAKKQGKQVEMDMGIFLQFIEKSKIIGVTGTKGKSTTTALIGEILKTANKKVVMAGNIGISILDSLKEVTDDSLILLELSSFQLESFDQHQISPHITVITNIFPDHLNYYNTMDQYIKAKKIIAKYQNINDFLLIKKDDKTTDTNQFLEGINSTVIKFEKSQLPANFSPKLSGEHNLANFAAALAVVGTLGIEQNTAIHAMENFTGVEFRLQLIKEWNGLKIYNDTTATNPGATIQALNTFPGAILIAGGMNKNMPYEDLAKIIQQKAKAVFFLEGDATNLLLALRESKGSNLVHGIYRDLEKLLQDVKNYAKQGDIILFSPGATSFNLFQNEFDRGRKFNQAVEKIFS